MYFPKYWAKGTVKGPNRVGTIAEAEAWGWSDLGLDEARRRGEERARATLLRLPSAIKNREAYYEDGNRPFREPILQDLSQGAIKAIVSRNSFGCEVLNTDSVAFADLDYPEPPVSFFQRLFHSGVKKAVAARASWETGMLNNLQQWQANNFNWTFRVYRTAGGLRLLVTSKLFPAGTTESSQWLVAVGNDPLYEKLCRNQKSYRARLTPKPWRCDLRQLTVRFPWDTVKSQQRVDKWLIEYEKLSRGFAVCRFLETIGSPSILPELKFIVDLHDARTSVESALPLA